MSAGGVTAWGTGVRAGCLGEVTFWRPAASAPQWPALTRDLPLRLHGVGPHGACPLASAAPTGDCVWGEEEGGGVMAPTLPSLPEATATLAPGAPSGLCTPRTTRASCLPAALAHRPCPCPHFLPRPLRPLPPLRHRDRQVRVTPSAKAGPEPFGGGGLGCTRWLGLVATGLGVPPGTFPLSWVPGVALVSGPDPEAAGGLSQRLLALRGSGQSGAGPGVRAPLWATRGDVTHTPER